MTPRDKKIIEDSEREDIPIFVFTAKDVLAINALTAYYHDFRFSNLRLSVGHNPQFIADLKARIYEFRIWQKANLDRVKFPD